MTSHTVCLQDAEALPPCARIKAECVFAGALERRLGGADSVATTYKTWIDASECTADILTAEAAATAARWHAALREAEQAALRDVGHFEGTPHFDIRLAKPQATQA